MRVAANPPMTPLELVRLKMLRGNTQDLADVEKLA